MPDSKKTLLWIIVIIIMLLVIYFVYKNYLNSKPVNYLNPENNIFNAIDSASNSLENDIAQYQNKQMPDNVKRSLTSKIERLYPLLNSYVSGAQQGIDYSKSNVNLDINAQNKLRNFANNINNRVTRFNNLSSYFITNKIPYVKF